MVTTANPDSNPTEGKVPPLELPACDLVMKGGITSGVVYPKLIARLSEKYRFISVGGTSAGAIAAGACVAAEFGRRSGTHPDAFKRLAELPELLGKKVGGGTQSKLLHLFQPAPALRDHFAVLVGSLNAKSKTGALVGALWALVLKFWPLTWVAVLAVLLLIVPAVRAVTALAGLRAVGGGVLTLVLWLVVLSALTRLWVKREAGIAAAAAETALAARSAPAAALGKPAGDKAPDPVAPSILPLLGGGLGLTWLASTVAMHAWGASWLVAALGAAACAVAVVLCLALALGLASWRFVRTLLVGLQGNFWGLCSGRTLNAQPQSEGLTEWLTGYFNGLAGLAQNERPLTLGDLWAGQRDNTLPEAMAGKSLVDTPARDRVLNLQVMTTAISQQMSYSLPLRAGSGPFYYEPEEWSRLFPPSVMQWLERVSPTGAAQDDARLAAGEPLTVRNKAGKPLRRLPANRHWPVVVAVRMSLSFPVLLSAVPLYARDWSLIGEQVDGQLVPRDVAKRVWFSDGGISSNMPLHMFDAPLPGRPTFAVNLAAEHPAHRIRLDQAPSEQKGRVYLPQNNASGHIRYWAEPEDSKPSGLLGFLLSIVDTMQNWHDEIQFPCPGYRDRIVQVFQLPTEGGLNLNMELKDIERLSEAGECAGQRLLDRFHPTGPDQGEGWHNHQKVRLLTFLGLVEELVRHPRVGEAQWDAVVDALVDEHYNHAEARLGHKLLQGLRDLGAHCAPVQESVADKMLKPRPEMRITPRV
jgi:Patatin-like phospholipase